MTCSKTVSTSLSILWKRFFLNVILTDLSISRPSHWKIFLSVSFQLKIVISASSPHMVSCAGPHVRSSSRTRPICFIKLIFYTYWFRFQVYLFQWDKIEYRLLMNTSKTLKRLFKNPYIYPFPTLKICVTLIYTVVP